MWPGLLLALFTFSHLQNPLLHLRQPALGGAELLALRLGRVLLNLVQRIDRVFNPGQIGHPIPRLFIAIFQLEEGRADQLHRLDLQRSRTSVLHLAQGVAEVPLDLLRPRLQYLP